MENNVQTAKEEDTKTMKKATKGNERTMVNRRGAEQEEDKSARARKMK